MSMSIKPSRWVPILAGIAIWMIGSSPTLAHVKWFVNFSFGDPPLTIQEVVTPTFIGLAILSAVVIGALVPIDLQLNKMGWYNRLNETLESYSSGAYLIMRVGTGAVMLMVWQADTLLAPELPILNPILGWTQFVIALLLLTPRTSPIAGAGVILLWIIATAQFGIFHMLDYIYYPGVGLFLMLGNQQNPRLQQAGIPILYFTVGFSLLWVALEKLVYPDWGLYLLAENPQLALGLPQSFFLVGAAFVELSLGYLLIICLLERPLSLVITLVFFTTTTIFGKTEIIGHTLIHAVLIVFVITGPGHVYRPPISFHKNLNWRIAFASVNFILAVGLLLGPYVWTAQQQYRTYLAENPTPEVHDIADLDATPGLSMEVIPIAAGGYHIRIVTDDFEFSDPSAEPIYVPGEGYVQIQVSSGLSSEVIPPQRVYGEWYYLQPLPPGRYQIFAFLHGADRGRYMNGNNPIGVFDEIVIEP